MLINTRKKALLSIILLIITLNYLVCFTSKPQIREKPRVTLTLCSRYTFSKGEVVPLDEKEEFIVSQRSFTAIVVLYNISSQVNVSIQCFAPSKLKVFELSFIVNPLLNFSVNRVPKFYVVIVVPLSQGNIIDVFCKAFAYIPIVVSKDFTLDISSKIGQWKIDVIVDDEVVATKSFTVRKPYVKIITKDIYGRLISNTTIIVLGLEGKYEGVFSGPTVTLELLPSSYIIVVQYMRTIVANKTIEVISDSSINIVCQVYDIEIVIYDDLGKNVIPNATVKIIVNNKTFTNITSKNGSVVFTRVPLGKYPIKVYYDSKEVYNGKIEVTRWSYKFLLRTNTAFLEITAKGSNNQALKNVKIRCVNTSETYITDAYGKAIIGPLPYGTYIIKVSYKDLRQIYKITVPPQKHVIILDVFFEVDGVTFSRETFYAIVVGSTSTIVMIIVLVFTKRTFFKKEVSK
ncbi:MAG: hypothetical protein DRJ52_01860 [Thermoprotei archaeon]|nr:MAG: hypothetical protein DRJ52_01860 [Thermoprotei archaeon]